MTTINEAFEAWFMAPGEPFSDEEDAARQAFEAGVKFATERAAKLCDDIGDYESSMRNTQGYQAADACAAAIRAGGEKT